MCAQPKEKTELAIYALRHRAVRAVLSAFYTVSRLQQDDSIQWRHRVKVERRLLKGYCRLAVHSQTDPKESD